MFSVFFEVGIQIVQINGNFNIVRFKPKLIWTMVYVPTRLVQRRI